MKHAISAFRERKVRALFVRNFLSPPFMLSFCIKGQWAGRVLLSFFRFFTGKSPKVDGDSYDEPFRLKNPAVYTPVKHHFTTYCKNAGCISYSQSLNRSGNMQFFVPNPDVLTPFFIQMRFSGNNVIPVES